MNKAISIIIIIVVAYFIAFRNDNKILDFLNASNQKNTSTVPTDYKGKAGLDYLKQHYSSGLAQAKSLCASQFKGTWTDSANSIGCYNMKGFSTYYCSMDYIKGLIDLCREISGNPVCSSTQASCSV
jgi:hypothetical protein